MAVILTPVDVSVNVSTIVDVRGGASSWPIRAARLIAVRPIAAEMTNGREGRRILPPVSL
jgi:hypothetical protein